MDAAEFERRTGRKPDQDDLERVNCPHAGEPMHMSCGWCDECDRPQFECGCAIIRANLSGYTVRKES